MAIAATIIVGCGGPKEAPEPQASVEQGSQAASNWTEEQKAAFAKAHAETRAGGDK